MNLSFLLPPVFLIWNVAAWASPPKNLLIDLNDKSYGKEVVSVQKLPNHLKSALARTFVQDRLDLGNPTEPIGEELSVAGQPRYPDRRLIFAFETAHYYIVYLEYRPPAVHASILVYAKVNGKIPLVWAAVDLRMPPFAKNRKELATLVKAGKLREGRFIW
ncbi:MAG TPA: hypothetical protein VJU77_08985 [Chthoniobacterales bacterium]|nr:hypothetical protein [Chthoniobacterales bacterium]